MGVSAQAPLANPRAFREAIRSGGCSVPCLAIPSREPRKLYIIAERRHLDTVELAYERFRNAARSRNLRPPSASFTLVEIEAEKFNNLDDIRTVLKPALNENIRLSDDNIRWGPKRYFVESIDEWATKMLNKLHTMEPNAEELRLPRLNGEHETEHNAETATEPVIEPTSAEGGAEN